MRGRRGAEQHHSSVSSGGRLGLEPTKDTGSVPAVRGRAWGSPVAPARLLAAHTVRALVWGAGRWGLSGCSAAVKEWVLGFPPELSTPGLACFHGQLGAAGQGLQAQPWGHHAGAGCLRGISFPKQCFSCDR